MERMDKTQVRKVKTSEQGTDFAYWQSRTPQERLEVLEVDPEGVPLFGIMELNLDFKEFFESLNRNKVRYLVVGGYAVAFHGHPRYTKDLDIWIDATASNAAQVIQSLGEFGFASLGLEDEDFLRPGYTIPGALALSFDSRLASFPRP